MAKQRKEIEIKLVGAPADVAAFRRSKCVLKSAVGEGAWERLVSTYYDDQKASLSKAGVSLRLREEAGVRIQTVKLRRKGEGTLSRAEYVCEFGVDEAFPVMPKDRDAAALLRGAGGLAPVARSVSDCWSVEIEMKRTRIEGAFDIGRLEALRDGEIAASAPLAEAELELLRGDAETLFKFARRSLKESGGRLRLSGASKEMQARGLLYGGAPGPENKLDLDAAGDVGDAFAAALKSAAARIIDLAPAITELRQVEGVHQMRVALRRFRAVERVFRASVDASEMERLSRRARRFAELLGPARDWDVFLGETLSRGAAGERVRGMERLRARAEALRAAAWDEAAAAIGSAKFNLFALDLLEAGHVQAWRKVGRKALREPVGDFAARALDEKLAAALAVAAGIDPGALSARHPLRIALKKLRYAAQTFRSFYPRTERKPFMASMSRLQDGLGAVNDAVVAEMLANAAALGQGKEGVRAAGFVYGFCMAHAQAVAATNDEALKDFEAMTPFWR